VLVSGCASKRGLCHGRADRGICRSRAAGDRRPHSAAPGRRTLRPLEPPGEAIRPRSGERTTCGSV